MILMAYPPVAYSAISSITGIKMFASFAPTLKLMPTIVSRFRFVKGIRSLFFEF
jgi:hypothetical protein